MFQEKRFSSNDEVIAATEGYFEAKDKSFYTWYRKVRKALE